jgi:competence protein ComEC
MTAAAGDPEMAMGASARPPSAFARALKAEIATQAGRWRLWIPIAFGLGAAGYLELRGELPLWAVAVLAILAWIAGWLAHRLWPGRLVAIGALLLAFAASGLLAGEIRSLRVAAPIAPASQRAVAVDAFVVDVLSPGAGGGARLLLAPVRIAGLTPEHTPVRLRATIDPTAVPGPGAAVRVLARLNPPPPPVSPGAYDFARDAWFDGIGGSAFAVGDIQFVTLEPPPWRLRWVMAVNAVRWSLARRIVEQMGPASGGLGAAMTTGHEAWIAAQQTDQMRTAGLAHIISISGLHMAIVGGFVFAAVRLAVAAWPWAALRAPGKKIAAAAGMAAIVAYLVLSGAPAPAERAAITACVAFSAILVDRRAISLHALAVAALIILCLQPEAAGQPGFQMSFAATAALVALAEAWPRAIREIAVPRWIKIIQGVGGWVGVSLGASLVAGLATTPFALQHFNRIAVFGLPANLAVAPLSSFVFMPALAIGTALTPLGLGEPFLKLAGWGIEAMTFIAAKVAALPHASLTVASAPPAALAVSFLGLMLLCLWRGRLRWVGLPMALAVNLWPRPAAPDIWVSSDGGAAAVREGEAAVSTRPDVRRFALDLWMRRRGLSEAQAGFSCSRYVCTPSRPMPVRLVNAYGLKVPANLDALCGAADVVVLRGQPQQPAPQCARTLLLTGSDFARGGSAELYRRDGGWRVGWAQDLRGRRPWTAISGSGE